MSIRAFLSVVVVLFLIGCAASSVNTPSELRLEYRFQTDKPLTYDLSSKSTEISEMMGQSIEVNTASSMQFTVLPKGIDQGNNDLQVTIDSSSLNITHPRGELKGDMGEVIGKSFTMQLSPLGKEMSLRGNENIQFVLGPMGRRNATNMFSALFSDLPSMPAKVGDTWTTKDTMNEGSGTMKVLSVLEGVSRLDGIETKSGYDCARIVSTFTGTLEGNGSQGPMQLSVQGTLSGTDTTFFAYEAGLLLHSTTEIAMKTTTEATGLQNLTIPGSKTTRVTLSFKGPGNKKLPGFD